MNSAISSVDTTEAKNGHSAFISRSTSRSASANAVPAPYQDGSSTRFCVHANTHGIARSASTPAEIPARDGGREPMFSRPSSEIGVICSKKRRKSSSS